MDQRGISILLLTFLTVVLAGPLEARSKRVDHYSTTVDPRAPSTVCIGCHDGLEARTASFCTVKCDFSTPHSILKPYPPPGRALEFAPLGVLAARGIRLEHGQVGCISCHNLKNPTPPHLVMDNAGSRLCRACHIKD